MVPRAAGHDVLSGVVAGLADGVGQARVAVGDDQLDVVAHTRPPKVVNLVQLLVDGFSAEVPESVLALDELAALVLRRGLLATLLKVSLQPPGGELGIRSHLLSVSDSVLGWMLLVLLSDCWCRRWLGGSAAGCRWSRSGVWGEWASPFLPHDIRSRGGSRRSGCRVTSTITYSSSSSRGSRR